jgi:hypothetical protein
MDAMIERQTPNMVDLANLLPLGTECQDMGEQWLRRLLKNTLLDWSMVIEPFCSAEIDRGRKARTNDSALHGPNRPG